LSLSAALNAARTGLETSSLRAEMTALNVANAATPGYVRRTVELRETLAGGETLGVRSSGISRASNDILSSERRLSGGDLAQRNVLSSAWQSISSRIGASVDGGTLFSAVSDLDAKLRSATATPESSAQAESLLQSAKTLASGFRSLSSMVVSERARADREITKGVEAVNQALQDVQQLNVRIMGADRTSADAAALFDERARKLDTIAEYLPIQTVERPSGAIDVVTTEGVYLLAGEARRLDFAPSLAFDANRTLANGALSGLSVDGINITPGAPTYGALSSGALSGWFQLRDSDLPALSSELDTMAADLIARFSDDTIDPTTPPGAPGLFIDADPSAGAGLAGRLQLNAAADPEQGGAVWRLRDGLGALTPGADGNSAILSRLSEALRATQTINSGTLQGTWSATDLAAQFSSRAGQSRIHHESVLASARAQHGMLAEAERTETGVDIDAQMQELILIEQAYAANARVIEIAGRLIDRLMEI
jgi:flagellar hook-associated protein 1